MHIRFSHKKKYTPYTSILYYTQYWLSFAIMFLIKLFFISTTKSETEVKPCYSLVEKITIFFFSQKYSALIDCAIFFVIRSGGIRFKICECNKIVGAPVRYSRNDMFKKFVKNISKILPRFSTYFRTIKQITNTARVHNMRLWVYICIQIDI